jgi:murein DD-endopeptidase MepM/ murein hydrolase activator NlpD
VKKDNALNKFTSPMNDAKVIEHKVNLVQSEYPSYGVSFKAMDSKVYSVDEGVVGNCLAFENSQIVIIEQQGVSYFYSNLKNTVVKNGDVIKQNQIIGLIFSNLANKFLLKNKILFFGKIMK